MKASRHASSHNCCCCGLPTDLFQYGHYWCAICEGRGHINEESANKLGKSHKTSEDCRRLFKNYIEDVVNEAVQNADALVAIAGGVDSCGYSHGSILHDVGKVMEFASKVLEGRRPHDVLKEMGSGGSSDA